MTPVKNEESRANVEKSNRVQKGHVYCKHPAREARFFSSGPRTESGLSISCYLEAVLGRNHQVVFSSM